MYVFFFVIPPPARSTLFPYTTLFRSGLAIAVALLLLSWTSVLGPLWRSGRLDTVGGVVSLVYRSEEHTSELQSHVNLVCRLLLEKKNPVAAIGALHDPHLCTRTASVC